MLIAAQRSRAQKAHNLTVVVMIPQQRGLACFPLSVAAGLAFDEGVFMEGLYFKYARGIPVDINKYIDGHGLMPDTLGERRLCGHSR